MKILIFNWKDIKHPYAGGAEVNIHEQAKRWVKDRHEVIQFSPKFKNSKDKELVDGVNIIRAGGRFSIYLIVPFYYLFKLRKETDVIIDIENGIPFFSPLFSRKPKICIMHHVHQNVFFKELPFFIAWFPYLLERYGVRIVYRHTNFVAVSKTTKEEMENLLGIESKNIQIVYNGINHNEFITDVTKTEYPSILYFGRLMKYKRIDLLIEIFKEVLKKIPNAKLHIAGSGIVENELKSYSCNIGIAENVIFHGFVDENKKKDLLKSSWVFVNPSSMEGWGVTVIEANAVSVPSISFNVPGLREAIRNNETGFIVNNKKEMINKLILLLTNKNLREKLGRNALLWSRKFSWDETARKTLEILKKLK